MSKTRKIALTALLVWLFAAECAAAGPAFVFDARFNPPLLDISSMDPAAGALAVQAAPDCMNAGRVISISRRGHSTVLEELSDIKLLELPAIADPLALSLSGREVPVTGARAYISGDGSAYAAAYLTSGPHYELRYKDNKGEPLFTATPKGAYGLSSVTISRDGSRVVAVDESPPMNAVSGVSGQRFYMYDRKGSLLSDSDLGDNLDNWLDIGGGAFAADGSRFIAARGRGGRPAYSLVMYGGDGRLSWEKAFYETHQVVDDIGGLVRVKGGNQAFISFVDRDGDMKVLERKGYGFEFWLSARRESAYIIKFKEFDLAKSGVPEAVKELFPKARLVIVDLNSILPKEEKNPAVEISPDGDAYILKSTAMLGSQPKTTLSLRDARSGKEIWKDSYFAGDVTARFTSGGKGFFVRFGYPVTRLIYYELK